MWGLIMKIEEYHLAIELRKKGYSFTEISNELHISKSTASVWCRNIQLSDVAQKRLRTKVTLGQMKSAENKRNRTEQQLIDYWENANNQIANQKYDQLNPKLFCSLLYWCEGGKYDNTFVQFTNSDPLIISAFLTLLRKSFVLNEAKFRVCIHLHSYHSNVKQTEFWSKLTKIKKKQFIKPFKKENSGKRIRLNYQGCLQIRYYDTKVTRDLLMTGKALLEKYGSLV